MEKKKLETVGEIFIEFSVICPQCKYRFDNINDLDWWRKTMGVSFPTDGTDGEYQAKCKFCNAEFLINGFSN